MVVALVCYESAYLAEIIRAGIQALPSGQQEAGRALGLSYLQTMRRVIRRRRSTTCCRAC